MTTFAIQHASEIVDGPSYVVHANHLIDNFNSIISDFSDRLSLISSSGQTITGAVTFSAQSTFVNGLKSDTISERTASAGVTIGNHILKSTVFKLASGGVPAAVGEMSVGFDGAGTAYPLFYTDGASYRLGVVGKNACLFTDTFSVSSSSTLGSGSGQVILATGFITLSIPAASSLPSYWVVHISNSGTGTITIDPNASETINGATTLNLYPGESCTIMKTGASSFTASGLTTNRPVLIFSQTASSSTTIDFTGLDSGVFTDFYFELKDIVPATNASSLYMRFSTNGGSSYAAGGSDYTYAGDYGDSAGGTSTPINSTGAAQILLGPANLMGNGTGQAYSSTVKLPLPLSTSAYKHVTVVGGQYSSTPRGINLGITGHYVGSQSAVNAVRFLMNTGNISSGVFECWGVRA